MLEGGGKKAGKAVKPPNLATIVGRSGVNNPINPITHCLPHEVEP